MSKFAADRFQNAESARKFLEDVRWPDGPICPHCGSVGAAYENASKPGVYRCAQSDCRKDFTVTVGTLFERSHVPLHKWLLATHLLMSSKKGMSAHQLHRTLEVTYKTAWFMAMRIREALRPMFPEPMGGEGSTVEIDESYVGGAWKNKHAHKRGQKGQGPTRGKEAVFALVERDGSVRSFHVPEVTGSTLTEIVRAHISGETVVYSDSNNTTRFAARDHKSDSVNHSIGEYVRGDVHTNTIEGFFSIMKRGITGTYHHVSQQHLKRYLAEFDFRYNERIALGVDDSSRTLKALKGIEGKRLTYGGPQAG